MKAKIFFAISLLFLTHSASYSQSNPERKALRGVLGVKVIIEELTPSAIAGGLTKEQLLTDVELRLRKAGIRVSDQVSSSFLYVNVHAMRDDMTPTYAIHIEVEFNREGTFTGITRSFKRVEFSHVASVWRRANLGIAGINRFSSVIREAVMDLTDAFANDFLAANAE